MTDAHNKLILFQEKQIRRVWHHEEWWFAVVDIIEALTESRNPAVYWRVLKNGFWRRAETRPLQNVTV